jgi:iron complex transport system ATP-binding protein
MPGKDTIPVISTRNLTIGYSSKKSTTSIASNISIELQSGELIGIIGGNGIGKSTLLKTLTKVQPPLSGEIYIKNKLLEQYTANSLAKTGNLIQIGLVILHQAISLLQIKPLHL